jgi:ATP-binding cassette subfamily B protein
MALPWLIKGGIDTALHQSGGASLLKYPLLILLAASLQGFFRYCWRININGLSRRSEADLRDLVFAHLQKLPLSYFQRTKTGDLMSRLTNDVQAVRELLGFGTLAIVDALIVIVFSVTMMIAIDPWLTLWSMCAMPLISVAVRIFGGRIFRKSRETQEQLSEMSAFVQENLAGMRVVQAYAQEPNQIEAFRALSTDYRHKTMWLATLWGIFWPLIQVLSGIAATLVLWRGGRQVLQGAMTLGEYVAFNGYLTMLAWPLMAIGYVVNSYQRGSAALSRLGEVLDVAAAPRFASQQLLHSTSERLQGNIEVRGLTFGYDARIAVLRDVSLSIPAGKSCGIVGATGSGKSTLISLFLRLYDPPDGTIFIDGTDIKRLPLSQLLDNVGLVAQDIFLFSGTIRENIEFGTTHDGPARVDEASRIAQLLPAIEAFSDKFETVVGERGVRLSGGQKQRAALARAIIKNPPILILDDAFSSVDVETEEEILKELKSFMVGRTTLLISHRVSTVRTADIIIYLRDGQIIEQGSHEELIARGGAYYELFRRQELAHEVEKLSHAVSEHGYRD